MIRTAIFVSLVACGAPLATAQDTNLDSTIQRLASKEEKERIRALIELGELGPKGGKAFPSVSRLQQHDPNPRVRLLATVVLGRLGSAAAPAVPRLIKALQGSDRKMRLAATTALGWIGKSAASATEALVSGVKGADTDLREQSLLALSRIGSDAASATPAVVKVLQGCFKKPYPEAEEETFRYAVKALGAMGGRSKAALEALFQLLEAHDREGEEENLGLLAPRAREGRASAQGEDRSGGA